MADSTKTQANLPTLGRYTLIKKIAVGGMAEIYLARVSGLGGFEKNVVLKRILPQLAESEEFFKMFLDEARIAATLQHPNIVTVHDAGEVDGEYFIAMEFLDGADVLAVRRILADRGETLPLEQAILIGSSVAAALHYAHEKRDVDGTPLGIVHRDVTPHNVFLTRDGAVKLVDFGIAKAKGRKSKTTYGTLKGKLAYMSPEQCQGEEVDRRSDLYSLGILLYELTTGRRLYRGKSEYVVLKEIVEGTIEPPSSLMSFPSELENIIMKALEKDPDRRFKTARKMQEALEKFARTNQLALSALSLSEFLEPLLTEADRRAKARARKRAANAPASGSVPSVGSSFETMEVQTVEAVEEFGAGIDSLLRGVGIGLDRPDTSPPALLNAGAEVSTSTPHPVSDFSSDDPPPPSSTSATRVITEDPFVPSAAEQVADAPAQIKKPVPVDFYVDPGDISIKKSRVGLMLFLLMLGAAAAGSYYYFVHLPNASHVADTFDAAPDVPSVGQVVVMASPAQSSVWLQIGRTPTDSMPLSSAVPHRIRIEHEGYADHDMILLPSMWTVGAKGPTAQVSVTLEQAAKDYRAVAAPTIAASDETKPGASDGVVSFRSTPTAAKVWLYVGVTPEARKTDLDPQQEHQFRIAKDGFIPTYITVSVGDFASDGIARVNTALVPSPGAPPPGK